MCFLSRWHTNAHKLQFEGDLRCAEHKNHWCWVNRSKVCCYVQFDRFGLEKSIAGKIAFHDSLFLRGKMHCWTAEKLFAACQWLER